jgi:hypothetical protein
MRQRRTLLYGGGLGRFRSSALSRGQIFILNQASHNQRMCIAHNQQPCVLLGSEHEAKHLAPLISMLAGAVSLHLLPCV